jgi:hypothetical protein
VAVQILQRRQFTQDFIEFTTESPINHEDLPSIEGKVVEIIGAPHFPLLRDRLAGTTPE